MPLPFGDGPDRTRCGIGLGHAGSGWKTGALGLREAKCLSCGWPPSPWWSLGYKSNQSLEANKYKQEHTIGFTGICSALSTSIAGSVAMIAEPTTDGGSTGVKTPELLEEELSGSQTPQESYPT